METKKYSYGLVNKISSAGFLICATFFFLIGIFFLYDFFQIILFQNSGNSITSWEAFKEFFLLSVWSPFFFIFISWLTPDVTVQDSGLLVNFVLKNSCVDWNNVVEIKPARFLGLPRFGKLSIILVDEGLTRFHMLYGILYGASFHRGFLVSSYIKNHHSLMKTISSNIKSAKRGETLKTVMK
jgi:hypothetical protein